MITTTSVAELLELTDALKAAPLTKNDLRWLKDVIDNDVRQPAEWLISELDRLSRREQIRREQ
jgi:hypothetical protein